MAYNKMVDADTHVLEPPDLWLNYLEPEYRDKAPRIVLDDNGLETWYFNNRDGKTMAASHGKLGYLTGCGLNPADLRTPGKVTWLEAAGEAGRDAHERIKYMDRERMDVAVLYPTLGLHLDAEMDGEDPNLAAAYSRAYNNWVYDWCSPYPNRLVPVPHISLKSVSAAVEELRRVEKKGARNVFVSCASIGTRSIGHPDFDPFWGECESLGIGVGLHVVVGSHRYTRGWQWGVGNGMGFANSFLSLEVMVGLGTLIEERVFDRFPRIQVGTIEIGGGWLPWFIEHVQWQYDTQKPLTDLKKSIADYFHDNIYVAFDPDETSFEAAVPLIGADRCMWGSDFPHLETHQHPVRELERVTAVLDEEDRRLIYGAGAAKFYGLDGA